MSVQTTYVLIYMFINGYIMLIHLVLADHFCCLHQTLVRQAISSGLGYVVKGFRVCLQWWNTDGSLLFSSGFYMAFMLPTPQMSILDNSSIIPRLQVCAHLVILTIPTPTEGNNLTPIMSLCWRSTWLPLCEQTPQLRNISERRKQIAGGKTRSLLI